MIREKSKQLTEQAAAIVCLTVLNENDGRKPDATSPNDDIFNVWRKEFHDDSIFRHKSKNSGKDGNFNMVASRTECESDCVDENIDLTKDKLDEDKTQICDKTCGNSLNAAETAINKST